MTVAATVVEPDLELDALHSFACPVCGRIRPLSPSASRAIVSGTRTGECRSGVGCRSALDDRERLLRFWLVDAAQIDERDVRRCGGAAGYVLEHGLPDLLADLADVLPADCEAVEDPHGSLAFRASR